MYLEKYTYIGIDFILHLKHLQVFFYVPLCPISHLSASVLAFVNVKQINYDDGDYY